MDKNVSFTPGPWYVREGMVVQVWPEPSKARSHYAICQVYSQSPHKKEQQANARLIAESPNLLWALTGARDRLQFALEHVADYEQRLNIEAEIQIANTAIARAEGATLERSDNEAEGG